MPPAPRPMNPLRSYNGSEIQGISNGLLTHEYRQVADSDENSENPNRRFKCCDIARWSKYFPFLEWITRYRKGQIIGDLIAGLSVGITAIPQTMAYAILAGLKPEYGLYSAFIPPFMYIFFGGCRQVTIGPSSIISLLAYETCGPEFPECIALTAFYSGIFEVLLSLLRLGWIVSLISDPVTVGFTTGAAITISSSQLRSFLGYSAPSGRGFANYWKSAIRNFSYTNVPDAVLASCCLCLLVIFQTLNLKPAESSRYGSIITRIQWGLKVSRNVIVVLGSTLIAYCWDLNFTLTGFVTPGLPTPSVPSFSLPVRINETVIDRENFHSFTETLCDLGPSPLIIGLVAILQNVAINKFYGTGQRINGNLEIRALGLCGIVGGFFSAQPVSASFTRSAVNDKSGVQSPLGGLFTGLLIIFALTFLTKAFYYIPRASLAAVIICAVMSMIDFKILYRMWTIKKIDLITFALTFVVSIIYGMEYGIGVGVTLSILLYLFPQVSSKMKYELRYSEQLRMEYLVLYPAQGFQFPNVDKVRKYISQFSLKYPSRLISVFVLDCQKWTDYDYTGIACLVSLIQSLRRKDQFLVLLNLDSEIWGPVLEKGGLTKDDINNTLCFCVSELEPLLHKLHAGALNV